MIVVREVESDGTFVQCGRRRCRSLIWRAELLGFIGFHGRLFLVSASLVVFVDTRTAIEHQPDASASSLLRFVAYHHTVHGQPYGIFSIITISITGSPHNIS